MSRIRTALALALALCALHALAQPTPVGLWRTIDDSSGKEKSLVRIVETDGVLSGTIEEQLDPAATPGALCDKCPDERKDKAILGLTIIRGAKASDDKTRWEGGDILDPDNGKVYRLRLTPVDGGKALEVRGYIGTPLFGRTQTWIRAE
jgi:uncharacterized protein (DUF2147 family)